MEEPVHTDEDDRSWFHLTLPEGYPLDDLLAVSEILAAADICVPGYIPPDSGLYDPGAFLFEMHMDRVRTVLLTDRNVSSRLAQVIQGLPASDNKHRRLAAAIMGFAQCLDIDIEPSVAFHELASTQGNSGAFQELAWFREADKNRAQDWLDVALSRADAVATSAQPIIDQNHDLELPLRRWRRNYILALKIAELDLERMSAANRMRAFLDWMYNDFILGGPAALLAFLYFAPNSPPRKGLFKELRSPIRERAIRGIRNAAWDLTHLSDFIERVQKSNYNETRYLFATFDKGLRLLASMPFAYDDDASGSNGLVETLGKWWPKRDLLELVEVLNSYYAQARSPEWYVAQQNMPGHIGALIEEGERLIRRPV